jgi:hypothetical protein
MSIRSKPRRRSTASDAPFAELEEQARPVNREMNINDGSFPLAENLQSKMRPRFHINMSLDQNSASLKPKEAKKCHNIEISVHTSDFYAAFIILNVLYLVLCNSSYTEF